MAWPNEKPRQDRDGNHWNLHYWYNGFGSKSPHAAQRLFFWNKDQTEQGVILFAPGKSVPYIRIKNLILKLVADKDFRRKYNRDLIFPLEKNYSDYPVFPEEFSE